MFRPIQSELIYYTRLNIAEHVQIITMQLKEIYSFSPSKYAYHLNPNPLVLAVHPSSHFLAFVTRGSQIAYYNRRTGRASILYASKHGIALLVFTQHYLLAVERTMPEVLMFSIKTQKIKKKITGHRSQVLTAAYCPHRRILATASHDSCMIWDQLTLSCIKVLKCSTSSYCDCHFTANGQYLFTAFSDGNIFGWDLDAYKPKQYALSVEPHRVASGCSQFVAAYSYKKLSVADFSLQALCFQVLEPFWDGYIEHVDFVDSFLLVKTTQGLYLSEIVQQNSIKLRNPKKLVDEISSFEVVTYASEVVVISKDLSKIRTMRVFTSALSEKVPLTNTLINPADQCMGGYSLQEGCAAGSETLSPAYGFQYQNQNYKLQQMNDGLYHHLPAKVSHSFSNEKMKAFIRKNYILPDKYRPLAYKHLLGLPIAQTEFLELERKGRHPCIRLLDSKYPLDNLNLSEALKDIVSLLAHYSPIFAQSELVPTLVFPFVCILGEDRHFCFEVLYRLFNHWLACLFANFPLANSQLLQNIMEIFEKEDMPLLNHLTSNAISFTKLAWGLLSTLLATNLNRDGFLAVVDTLICHPQDPSLVIFIVVGYIEYNRSRILSLKSEKDLDVFLDEQHTVNMSTLLRKCYELKQKYHGYVRYPFRAVSYKQDHYLEYSCFPKHAVKMYEGKRLLEQQQYEKFMNNQRYHEELGEEMQKMVTKIKRESDKAVIESQAVALQSESQSKNRVHLARGNPGDRKRRLKELMCQIESLVKNREDKKLRVREFIPLLSEMKEDNNEEQLDQIEQRLMQLMTKVEPRQFHLPLNSQPMTFGKHKVEEFKSLKAAKRAQMASKLWEADQLAHELQGNRFEHDFERAMKI